MRLEKGENMSFKLGMPTLIEFKSIEEDIDLCSSLGLDFIELNMNLPYCMAENNNISRLKKTIEANNLEFTMHFPEEIDFAVFYPSIRTANIELFKELSNYGAELGIKKINIHINSGVYFSLPNHKAWIYEINKDKFIDNLMGSVDKIINISKQNDIMLCVENTAFPDFIKDAFNMLSKLENIYFTWDVGHDAKDNYRASNFYLNNENKIVHMHLHDCDAAKDHISLYDGIIDISSKVEFARFHNLSTVVEVKTSDSLRKSIYALRTKGY
ncbi:sugar phosphate isomerase/epimerase family protein [Candidatus Clostridium radicumherbarum]|uniref:Sugar phosphate isomerase/epimerase family protein n=1 Tax=Candidatus Clostridium radicumherbarum TaxID=3381662 RepID=A0ABW8TYM0_9CLOT